VAWLLELARCTGQVGEVSHMSTRRAESNARGSTIGKSNTAAVLSFAPSEPALFAAAISSKKKKPLRPRSFTVVPGQEWPGINPEVGGLYKI